MGGIRFFVLIILGISIFSVSTATAEKEEGKGERIAAKPSPPAFESAATATSPSALLRQILLRVEANASALQIAKMDLKGKAANERAARSNFFGEVDSFVRDIHFDGKRLVNPLAPPIDINSLPFDSNQVGFGLEARLPLDVNGRISAQLRNARHLKEAAEKDVEDVRLRLFNAAAEVEGARAGWSAAEKRKTAATSGLSFAEETARIQASRFKEGRLTAADLVDAEATLAKARAVLSTSMVDWWRADDDLRLALGRPPADFNLK